jgi:hypothetical protein
MRIGVLFWVTYLTLPFVSPKAGFGATAAKDHLVRSL